MTRRRMIEWAVDLRRPAMPPHGQALDDERRTARIINKHNNGRAQGYLQAIADIRRNSPDMKDTPKRKHTRSTGADDSETAGNP